MPPIAASMMMSTWFSGTKGRFTTPNRDDMSIINYCIAITHLLSQLAIFVIETAYQKQEMATIEEINLRASIPGVAAESD